MKKILLLFITLLIAVIPCSSAFSREFLPRYSDSISFYGIGVYFAPKTIRIFSEPIEESKLIRQIQWDRLGISSLEDELSTKNVFIAFVPRKNIALMSVLDESGDWYQVVYNQITGEKGWIKKSDTGKFMTWLEFMSKYGRDLGVYLFLDLPERYRQIHMSPDEAAQIQNNCLYSPEDIRLKIIRGNWMLVKVIDYSKTNTYIGWIKWRNNDGRIFAFPNLKKN